MFKALFEALLGTNRLNSNAFMIAKHIASIVLQEKKGLVEKLYPDFKIKAEQIQQKFPEITIISTLRTFKMQDDLYAQGRTTPGTIVTAAKGGQSYHNYCLAFDFYFTDTHWDSPRARWEKVGVYAESLGCVWGGRFGDLGHVEWHPTFTWQELYPHFKDGN